MITIECEGEMRTPRDMDRSDPPSLSIEDRTHDCWDNHRSPFLSPSLITHIYTGENKI